ncbi:MAG: hypothetical protein J6X66_08490 [Lachnospiraceae bacterium]|nr:hypothetical protein [Lachnospiraceae bacterium]
MLFFNNPYKNDYDHRPERDTKGRFKDVFFYTGDYHELSFDLKTKKRIQLSCLLFGLLFFSALLLPGLLNQPSSRSILVCLPYVFMFLPLIFYFSGVFSFFQASLLLTRERFDKSVLRMKHSAVALLVLAIISLICGIRWMIMNKGGSSPSAEIIYLLGHLPLIVLVIVFGKYYDKSFTVKEKEESAP